MDAQLHFAQKISKKSLKLAEINLFEFWQFFAFFGKKPTSRENQGHSLIKIIIYYFVDVF